MRLSVFAIAELSDVAQQFQWLSQRRRVFETVCVEGGIVVCNLIEAHAAEGGRGCAEIGLQEFVAQSDGFEDFRTAIGADGADAHLRHDFVETLAQCVDVVLLRRVIVHLNFPLLHKVVQDGECHVGVDGTCAVAEQQGCVHHLSDFAAFNDESGFDAFLNGDEVVVNGADGEEGGNDGVVLINSPVAQDNVVHTVQDALLGFSAEAGEGGLQSGASLFHFKEHGEFDRLEAFVLNVAEQVKLTVPEHGVGQAHHFAVTLIGVQDVFADGANVFRQ